MINTILFGFTTGAIFYFISIGFSLTFGTMRVINFAHAMSYAIGAYIVMTVVTYWGIGFEFGMLFAMLLLIPLSYVIERFIIRRLYGESLDYAFIATFAVALISIDLIKWIWGVHAHPLRDPIRISLDLLGLRFPLYRLLIVMAALILFVAIQLFMKRTIVGKVIIAAMEDKDHVRALGISVEKYFSLVFVIGSVLAACGGALYAPITAIHPYMGMQFILLCFAVVVVGGMGNINGTFYSAFALGMVVAITGRYWPQGAEAMIFVAMAVVLIIRPIDI